MKIFTALIFCSIALPYCSSNKIEITPEYIINENWNKRDEGIEGNSIEIKRMKVKKDSMINPFADLTQVDILDKLEVDSSFIYTANVKINNERGNSDKKIYFNRDNGFYWWADQGERKIRVLGKLQTSSWYEISRLSYYYYVIYIDSADKVHQFIVNQANY
ncbi:MAG TPA: hypothetical protein PKE30_20235 [Niabella sp.]|nr:hypothetical protein [Niabella sp.]